MISVCHKCRKTCFDTSAYYCNLTALKQQYKDLERKYAELEQKYNFMINQSNELLTLDPQKLSYINSNFKRYKNPRMVEYSELLPYWRFITITFDPRKFGVNNKAEDEKNYILYSLLKVKHYFDYLYGCFEYQDNGAVHSHLIARIKNNGPLEKELRAMFTNERRNDKAVQIVPAKYPGAINYINKIEKPNKRGDEWFIYQDRNLIDVSGLDDGIENGDEIVQLRYCSEDKLELPTTPTKKQHIFIN